MRWVHLAVVLVAFAATAAGRDRARGLPCAAPQLLPPLFATRTSSALCPAGRAGVQQHPSSLEFYPAPQDQALAVASEAELQAALAAAGLGFAERRPVQLTADIHLSATLEIRAPVRLQGACGSDRRKRCVLAAAHGRSMPLLHVTGPAAVVELANLELTGGMGAGSLAGGLTASNHSMVDLVNVRLAGNSAASGGALRADSHARLGLAGCEVVRNAAQVGAVFSFVLHKNAGC